jgi:hypothetical protein
MIAQVIAQKVRKFIVQVKTFNNTPEAMNYLIYEKIGKDGVKFIVNAINITKVNDGVFILFSFMITINTKMHNDPYTKNTRKTDKDCSTRRYFL